VASRRRAWRTILWLVAMAPAVAYLVVGGFPATRGLQQTMAGPVGTGLLLTGLVAGIVVTASQVPALVRHLRASHGPVWHEAAIRPAARLATVTTTVLVAVVLTTRLVAADGDATGPVLRSYHVLDALSMAVLVLGLALLLMAFITVPPMALAVTSVGLVAIEGSVAVSAGYLAAGTLTVAAATMLHEAADGYDDIYDRYGEYDEPPVRKPAPRQPPGSNTPRSNGLQNEQAKSAVREAERRLGRELDRREIERVHREITKQGMSRDEIIETIVGMFP